MEYGSIDLSLNAKVFFFHHSITPLLHYSKLKKKIGIPSHPAVSLPRTFDQPSTLYASTSWTYLTHWEP